jgi:serine phosphatase RsbU (regulator of sigma subunit)
MMMAGARRRVAGVTSFVQIVASPARPRVFWSHRSARDPRETKPTVLRPRLVSLYTFLAVLLVLFAVGAIALPVILRYVERSYFRLQSDVNRRQALAMSRFVQNRLASGASRAAVVAEFQDAIEGTQTDRGYVCLIDQNDLEYLCHPNLELLGMSVKPQATFDPEFSGRGEVPWQDVIQSGESASGLLHLGPGMPSEIVHFRSLPNVNWTISSHENSARVRAEVARLRMALVSVALILGLLIGVPASVAARTVSRRYEAQVERRNELQRRFLERENERKSRELEEARQLQLSMLPSTLPDHSGLEVAAYMLTASEVGGDYYDFDLDESGTLTFVIGDAAGHGARAGILVTATKSLFGLLSREPRLDAALSKAARALKGLASPQLYMALAAGRFRDGTLELAGAGMPSALVHRFGSNRVEKVSLSGLPLGIDLDVDVPYETKAIALSAGDTVVLMSDGVVELFDEAGEMLGYERTRAVLEGAQPRTAGEVVEHLVAAAERWRGARPPEDDMTLVVLKVNELSRE